MPEIHDPRIPRCGPSHSFASSKVGGRRRRRRRGPITGLMASSAASGPLFDFDEEDETHSKQRVLSSTPSSNKRKSTTTTTKKKIREIKPPAIRKRASPSSSHAAKSVSVTPQQPRSKIQPLPACSIRLEKISPRLSHVRNSILVDTRALDTKEGEVIGKFFLYQVGEFLKSMTANGLVPSSVGSLYQKEDKNSPRSRSSIATKVILKDEITENYKFLQLPIRPSINFGNVHNRESIKVPTRLLANASWKVLGDLVQEAVSKDAQSSPPLTITLFSYDAALLCDSNMENHKAALTKFWNHIRPLFHKNRLATIDLVIFHTGTVVITGRKEKDSSEEWMKAAGDGVAADEKEMETEECSGESMNRLQETGKDDTSTSSNESARSRTVSDTVNRLREALKDLEESDYKTDKKREHSVTPVSISMFLIERNESFGMIARRWTKRILSPPNLKRNITFALPEMSDGTQCSISLDLSFRLLPYPMDMACGLLSDLRVLSSSNIEILQVCPMSCVDANLLFGVAMEALPGFQNEEDRYLEMKALVYVLFKKLRLKDLALLLRATPANDIHDSTHSYGSPLHHTLHQTYLLTAEDFPAVTQKSLSQIAIEDNPPLPLKGSLYRYGNADQMVVVGGGELYTPEVDAGTLDQLNEYIEASLEFFPKTDINPLVNEEDRRVISEMKHVSLSSSQEEANTDNFSGEEGKWNDKTGIGSTVEYPRDSTNPVATGTQLATVEETNSNMSCDEEEVCNDQTGADSTVQQPKDCVDTTVNSLLKPQHQAQLENSKERSLLSTVACAQNDEIMDLEKNASQECFKINEVVVPPTSPPQNQLIETENIVSKNCKKNNEKVRETKESSGDLTHSRQESLDDITNVVAHALKQQNHNEIESNKGAVVDEAVENRAESRDEGPCGCPSKEETIKESIVHNEMGENYKTIGKRLPQKNNVDADNLLFDTDEECAGQKMMLYRNFDEESVISDPVSPGKDEEMVSSDLAEPGKADKSENTSEDKGITEEEMEDESTTEVNGKSSGQNNQTANDDATDTDSDDWKGYRGVGFNDERVNKSERDDSRGSNSDASDSSSDIDPLITTKCKKSKLSIKYKGRGREEALDKSASRQEDDDDITVKYTGGDMSVDSDDGSQKGLRDADFMNKNVEESKNGEDSDSSSSSESSSEIGLLVTRKPEQSKLGVEIQAILEDSDIEYKSED